MHSTMGLRVFFFFPFFFGEISSLTDVSLFINIRYRSGILSTGKSMEEGEGKKAKNDPRLSSPVAAVSISYYYFIPCVTDTYFTPKSKIHYH